MNSRRGFLKTSVLLGGGALVGGGLFYSKLKHTRGMAGLLVSFLEYPQLALTVGQGVLKSDPTAYNISLEQMIDTLLQGINTSRDQLPEMPPEQLLDALHQRVRADFENEQIILVNGWLLSRTEAYLCSLLALLS